MPPAPSKGLQNLTHREYFKGIRKITKCDAGKPDKNFDAANLPGFG